MKHLILLIVFTCGAAFANPIVVMEHGTCYLGTKSSESCIAVLGETTSMVSCDVQYRLKKVKASAESYCVVITLPVFVSADEAAGGPELAAIFAPRIEFEGRFIAPDTGDKSSRIRNRNEVKQYKAPDGVDVVIFRFSLELGASRQDARFLVSYVQPTIHGKFLYIPLFEGGRMASGKGSYRLEALVSDPSLSIIAAGGHSERVTMSRMSFDLLKQELIELELKKG